MDTAKTQIVDIIKNNANILVTVSTNPSVDELSAALGLTVLLDNLDKRATAVFSGAIPPAIQFLEPDKTFENTADSLRDFIIALDKDKADHLRYKVEGDVVKIFITPYKTALSQDDLEFSQGDYNVEVVLALGVKDQDHLDKALEAHGKILHDANVLTVTAGSDTSSLGSLDWHDGGASSLSEMVAGLADSLKEDKPLLDEQTSTALLTGIVSATDRFSNNRTSSRAMTIAAQLMAAGANQQLIAAKLEEAHDIAPGPVVDTRKDDTNEAPKGKTESDTELSIKRSERNTKPEEESKPEPETEPGSGLNFETTGDELNLQPTDGKPAEEAKPDVSTEDANQVELEQKLADLNMSPIGTMADIEKELKETAAKPDDLASNAAPSADTAAQAPVLPELPQLPTQDSAGDTVVPSLEPTMPTEQPAPEIINEHGTFTEKPETESAPMNSIQSNPNEGEATVDPFSTSAPTVTVPPLTPDSSIGTPEGAALLASEPGTASASPAPEPITIPQLPPLPPLPPDASLPPLPPPPPPPTFDPSATTPQSGAVSGDVFGDGSTTTTDQPAPTPTEPGQFKIPGQP